MAMTALIPAAGRGLKPYPAWDTVEKLLHPIIDRDGVAKPVLQILLDEVAGAGIGRVVMVVRPGEETQYRQQLAALIQTLASSPASDEVQRRQADRLREGMEQLVFVDQAEQAGLGHSVWCARQAVRAHGERFLLMMCDHLFISRTGKTCAQQVVEAARRLDSPVSAVEVLGEHIVHRYGVVGGTPVPGEKAMWTVQAMREKPTPTQAELDCETPGLRRGAYLCLSGVHVLPHQVFDLLDERIRVAAAPGWGELTPVLSCLARTRTYYSIRPEALLQDIGTKFGLMQAQLERALDGVDRDVVLTGILESLARDGMVRR